MLQQTISNILNCENTIETQQFDEVATKQYVILPILRALDWENSNLCTLEVFPEKKVGSGKVDYSLQQDDNTFVFVECKRWGTNIERIHDQEQICLYASMAGVDIAVITNGKKWNFYLCNMTTLPGRINVPWEDRLFCSIDLGEDQEEAVFHFKKYLTKSCVEGGTAIREAKEALQLERADTPLPRQRYCLPLLRALKDLGGTAPTGEVLERVEQLMEGELRPIDRLQQPNGQVYWINRVHNMRRALVDRGLMNEDTQRGIWEISEEGCEYLRTNQGDLSR
ncbi:MAG: type I restriction enzyme HsdR N-terminal domain-containing protein [Candidatus Poribacteria bacterium]|nr:type I restriction enzyme HsdR N-terminal domain-containing protein [Candidatus Poribacteria bacterium]